MCVRVCVCVCVCACVRACACLSVCLFVCLSLASPTTISRRDISEQISDQINVGKVTAVVMGMHHVSLFCSLHLALLGYRPHKHDTGQRMFSERAFGVETGERCASLKNDVN